VKPLVPFFARFGMRIFDIKEVDIHGGSFRIFVDRGVRARTMRSSELPGARGARGRARLGGCDCFAGQVSENRAPADGAAARPAGRAASASRA
jgi:hypothetical protein